MNETLNLECAFIVSRAVFMHGFN